MAAKFKMAVIITVILFLARVYYLWRAYFKLNNYINIGLDMSDHIEVNRIF